MENLDKEAINELVHSLHEWGLSRTLSEHVTFKRNAVRDCVASISITAEPVDFDALKSQKFPTSYKDAYEHVLRHEGYPGDVFLFTDELKLKVTYPAPFFRLRNRLTGEVYDYRKRDEYKRFTSKQLDPLCRWEFNLMSLEENLFVSWFVDVNDASKIGILMEALVACHALASEACYNCKFRKSLRWNGGANASWRDMICTNCGAAYEVKTKKDIEAVEKSLRHNNIQAGSFSAWCQLKKSTLNCTLFSTPRGQFAIPMYLVILPRQHTLNRKLHKIHPVTIAEIDKVLPNAYEQTFNPKRGSIPFKSTVSVKLNTKAKWFDLPAMDETIPMGDISERVYKERFSEELYQRFSKTYLGSDSDDADDSENSELVADGHAIDSLEGVTATFQDMNFVPDDWEDLASDSS